MQTYTILQYSKREVVNHAVSYLLCAPCLCVPHCSLCLQSSSTDLQCRIISLALMALLLYECRSHWSVDHPATCHKTNSVLLSPRRFLNAGMCRSLTKVMLITRLNKRMNIAVNYYLFPIVFTRFLFINVCRIERDHAAISSSLNNFLAIKAVHRLPCLKKDPYWADCICVC